MGANPQIQALLKRGLLPLLLKKMGVSMPGGRGQPPGMSPQESTPASMGGSPQSGGMPSGGSAGPSPSIQPPSGGGPGLPGAAPIEQPHEQINSLAQLILGWDQRKHERKAAEMQNVWTDLMEAIDASKDPQQTKDAQQMIDIIMERHGKDLAKFFKGRFEQAQKQKESSSKSQKPDPVGQGLEGALQEKQQESQATSQSGPPQSGGYYLPMAGPEQQLRSIADSAELQAARQDPARMLKSQLTSGEMREAELGAGPEKARAEREKARAEIIKAGKEVQKAQYESKKAEAELQLKLTEESTAKEKGKIALDTEKERYLTAQANKDKANFQMMRAKLLAQGATQPKLTQALKLKLDAAESAKTFIDGIVAQDRDLSDSDVQTLQNLLKNSGAISLANGIRATSAFGWFRKGSADAKSLQKAFDLHYDALKASVGKAKDTSDMSDDETDDETDDTATEPQKGEPMEGDIVDGYYFKGGDPGKEANYRKATPEELEKSKSKKKD